MENLSLFPDDPDFPLRTIPHVRDIYDRMSTKSNIEWTEFTWNPATGCTKISPGCKHCYAEVMADRLQAMGAPGYEHGFKLTLHPDRLAQPLKRKKPTTYFVNSMSDLFHEDIPLEFIQRVFEVMNACTQHTFQVLTKRPDVVVRFSPMLRWAPNIWMGTSVENGLVVHRVRELRKTGARIKFLSVEPLIGPLPRLPLTGIHWAIVGGESGPGARPMKAEWVRQIRDRCTAHGVPFFFKQWGGVNKKRAGRVLDGRTWDEMPTVQDTDCISKHVQA